MPKVAIITPVYNAELFVEDTIRSVLAQAYTDWQLVMVDDGSADHSLEICKRYEYDSRVLILTQKNSGVASARNYGISKADKADYLTFLDSDDLLEPDFLQNAVSYMESHNDVVMLRTSFGRIRDDGKKWNTFLEWRLWNHQRLAWKLFDKDLARLFLLLGTFPPVGLLFRASAIVDEKWFQESLFGTEDSELLTRLALRNAKMHFSSFKGGSYRIRNASISTDVQKRALNYQKWLIHSFSCPEACRFPDNFKKLVTVMKNLQISNGLHGHQREVIEQEIVAALADIVWSQVDDACYHVTCSAVINCKLARANEMLDAIYASKVAYFARDVKCLLDKKRDSLFVKSLALKFFSSPILFLKSIIGLSGNLVWQASSNRII